MDIKFELLLSAKLIMAMVLGSLIGIERERDQKNIGIRTFASICLAACLFTAVSAHLTEDKSAVARIIAAVATGLGFMGGGIIFRNRRNVPQGLTTAASLWTTSAVGIAIALNMFVLAIVATLTTFAILSVNRFKWYKRFVGDFINKSNPDEQT